MAKVMIQYPKADGSMVIEKTSIDARFIEMRDGYHPVTNDSVWQDDKRMRMPIMVIPEGVLGPIGSDMAEEDVLGLLREVEIIKRSHKVPSISKMWLRMLTALFHGFMKWGLPAGMIIIVLYMLGTAVITGG